MAVASGAAVVAAAAVATLALTFALVASSLAAVATASNSVSAVFGLGLLHHRRRRGCARGDGQNRRRWRRP